MVTPGNILEADAQFLKYHQTLREELNNAYWHFAILKYLRETGKDYLKEFNQAPAFFGLTMDAHVLSALMRLNKFLDKKKEHLSIRSFLDFVEANLDIFSDDAFERRLRDQRTYYPDSLTGHVAITLQKVEEDRRKVNDLPASEIRRWRNSVLAHIRTEDVLEDINIRNEYPIQLSKIELVIDTLDDMLNDYLLAFDASFWAKHLALEDEIRHVLDAIRFKIAENRRLRGR